CAHLYRAVSRFIIRRAARSTLFPYTTLFRSGAERRRAAARQPRCRINADLSNLMSLFMHLCLDGSLSDVGPFPAPSGPFSTDLRSEEHTSELQSRENLVCRLLLEKTKPPVSK